MCHLHLWILTALALTFITVVKALSREVELDSPQVEKGIPFLEWGVSTISYKAEKGDTIFSSCAMCHL